MPDSLEQRPASDSKSAPAPLGIRLLRLAFGLFLIWLIVFVLAPLPLKYSDTLRGIKEASDALGIHPGSVYYTDVPTSGRAERNSREAVRLAGQRRAAGVAKPSGTPHNATSHPAEAAPRSHP